MKLSRSRRRGETGKKIQKELDKTIKTVSKKSEKVIDIGSITAEKLLWAFEKDEKTGNVTIVPMNGEQIVIHGKTEAEMFCSILTQCFQ